MASNVVNHVCLLLYLGARTGFQTAQDQRRGKGIFFYIYIQDIYQ